MSNTGNETISPIKEPRHTHVMFIENDVDNPTPVFSNSLKDLSDKANEIIQKNPAATCGIYQLRADLKGEIKIIREDFSN